MTSHPHTEKTVLDANFCLGSQRVSRVQPTPACAFEVSELTRKWLLGASFVGAFIQVARQCTKQEKEKKRGQQKMPPGRQSWKTLALAVTGNTSRNLTITMAMVREQNTEACGRENHDPLYLTALKRHHHRHDSTNLASKRASRNNDAGENAVSIHRGW